MDGALVGGGSHSPDGSMLCMLLGAWRIYLVESKWPASPLLKFTINYLRPPPKHGKACQPFFPSGLTNGIIAIRWIPHKVLQMAMSGSFCQ
jgi:hypothetical protein